MASYDKDASSIGSCCPVPLITLQRSIKEMQKGEVLRICGDDPIFEEGVRDYCSFNDHEVLEVKQEGDKTVIYIKV